MLRTARRTASRTNFVSITPLPLAYALPRQFVFLCHFRETFCGKFVGELTFSRNTIAIVQNRSAIEKVFRQCPGQLQDKRCLRGCLKKEQAVTHKIFA